MRVILFCVIALSGCISVPSSNEIHGYHERYDDYKGFLHKTFEFTKNSDEKYSPINSAKFEFTNTTNTPKLYVTLYSNPRVFYPEKIAYLKIDEEIYRIPFQNIENEKFKTNSESTKSIQLVDSTRTDVLESINTSEHFLIKFELSLTNQIKEELLNCSSASLRIYTGPKTNTFQFRDIENIRKVISK